MKTHYISLVILFHCCTTNLEAQSWQWGKSGGSTNALVASHPETVNSTCTDIYGNLYFASDVGPTSLIIGDVPEQTYSSATTYTDGLISSFSCDGTYRWSKVIGGGSIDEIKRLGSDAHGNIYAVGKLSRVDPSQTAVHFDTDLTLPSAHTSTNQYNQTIYLVKYDSNGTLKWLRMPQAPTINYNVSSSQTRIVDLQVDPDGNTYWLCLLPPETYAEGQLTVTSLGYHILKYDPDGAYIGSITVPMQSTNLLYTLFRYARNHTTGDFYIAGEVGQGSFDEGDVFIDGHQITKTKFLAAFTSTGSLLWLKETATDKVTEFGFSYGVAVDSDNNIYFTGNTRRLTNDLDSPPDSFNGIPFINTGLLATPWPFITKLAPTGETIWQTNGNKCSPYEIIVNGDEVAIVGHKGGTMQWQDQTHTSVNMGRHPVLCRFNKTTGAIIAINSLESTGDSDNASAVATDSKNNYYIGGFMASSMTVGTTTLNNHGSQSDFYIAKFGSDDCEFMGVNEYEKQPLQGYPNPVRTSLRLNNTQECDYTVYGVLGTVVKQGHIASQGTVDFEGVAAGVYVVEAGGVRMKVVKE